MSLSPDTEITDVTFDFDGAHLAICHKTQGFSANNKPMPLLIKSDEQVITDEALESLEKIMGDQDEVQIKTSMFDFLRKWYNLYWDEADSLARILGYTGDGFDESEYVDQRISGITLLKSGVISKTAKQKDIDQLAKFILANDLTDSFSEGNSEMKKEAQDASQPSEKTKTQQGELMATAKTDQEKELDKAKEVEARLVAMEKAVADAEAEKKELSDKVASFEKANQDRLEKAFIAKVATYSFITEEERENFAKALIDVDSEEVVLALDKAQAAIQALTKTQGVDGGEPITTATKTNRVKEMVMKQHGLTDVSK